MSTALRDNRMGKVWVVLSFFAIVSIVTMNFLVVDIGNKFSEYVSSYWGMYHYLLNNANYFPKVVETIYIPTTDVHKSSSFLHFHQLLTLISILILPIQWIEPVFH
jgi:hypothetical protein